MHIKFFGQLDYPDIDLAVSNIPQVLAGVRHAYGDDVSKMLVENKHYYVLCKTGYVDPIALHPQMVSTDFHGYDELLIVPDIGGDITAAAILAVLPAVGAVGAAVIATVINIAISIALSFIVQLLSPTLSFDSDPAQAQANRLDSSLFNGAPNIREQGGSVPIVVGNTHAGGVLISAGISSEEKII